MRALVVSISIGLAAACMNSPPHPVCMNSAPNGQCCDGLGCASGLSPLTVTVLDSATQQPIAGTVTFTSSTNTPIDAACTMTPSSPCPSWLVFSNREGVQDITVSATNYTPGVIHVDLVGPTGCCGQGTPVMATVTLGP